jgi:hypothetical protein
MIGCVLRQESPPDTRPRYLPCAPGPSGVGTFFYTPDGGLRGLEFVPPVGGGPPNSTRELEQHHVRLGQGIQRFGSAPGYGNGHGQ